MKFLDMGIQLRPWISTNHTEYLLCKKAGSAGGVGTDSGRVRCELLWGLETLSQAH